MIAEKIIYNRKKLKLSQEELAEKLNVSRQTVTKWENQNVMPGVEYLIALSQIFQMTIDRLVKDDDCFSYEEVTQVKDEEWITFLLTAKKQTYALKKGKRENCRLDSHDYQYEEQDFIYHDTFVGSEKFAGEETVYQNQKAIYSMNYYGRVLDEMFSGDFLKESLLHVSYEYPMRGPLFYQSGDYTYVMNYEGDVRFFRGQENIYFHDKKVYECLFHGGLIQ